MFVLSNLMSKNFVTQLVGISWGFYQRDLELKSLPPTIELLKQNTQKILNMSIHIKWHVFIVWG